MSWQTDTPFCLDNGNATSSRANLCIQTDTAVAQPSPPPARDVGTQTDPACSSGRISGPSDRHPFRSNSAPTSSHPMMLDAATQTDHTHHSIDSYHDSVNTDPDQYYTDDWEEGYEADSDSSPGGSPRRPLTPDPDEPGYGYLQLRAYMRAAKKYYRAIGEDESTDDDDVAIEEGDFTLQEFWDSVNAETDSEDGDEGDASSCGDGDVEGEVANSALGSENGDADDEASVSSLFDGGYHSVDDNALPSPRRNAISPATHDEFFQSVASLTPLPHCNELEESIDIPDWVRDVTAPLPKAPSPTTCYLFSLDPGSAGPGKQSCKDESADQSQETPQEDEKHDQEIPHEDADPRSPEEPKLTASQLCAAEIAESGGLLTEREKKVQARRQHKFDEKWAGERDQAPPFRDSKRKRRQRQRGNTTGSVDSSSSPDDTGEDTGGESTAEANDAKAATNAGPDANASPPVNTFDDGECMCGFPKHLHRDPHIMALCRASRDDKNESSTSSTVAKDGQGCKLDPLQHTRRDSHQADHGIGMSDGYRM